MWTIRERNNESKTTRNIRPEKGVQARRTCHLQAVEAMENFAEASARRDNWHGFKEADKPGEVVRNEDCDNCPVRGICPEHKKPEAFDVPKEVRAMAEFFGKMRNVSIF